MKSDKELIKDLINERLDLLRRYNKLAVFIYSKDYYKLSEFDQILINREYTYMGRYLDVLEERINNIETRLK